MRSGAAIVIGAGVVLLAIGGAVTLWLGGDDDDPSAADGTAATLEGSGDRTGADAETSSAEEAAVEDETPAVDGPAPQAVVAVQGPIEETARYVSVTWSHVDLDRPPDQPSRALGYDVERDGSVVGSTDVDDDPWDDMAFRDQAVSAGPHTYRVRTRFEAGSGPWSAPAEVDILATDDIGPVFAVDDYQGSDLDRAQQAVDDAEDAGGGVVLFGADTYEFSDSLVISGTGVLLRGAGPDRTVLRPGFAGGDESCGRPASLLQFRGPYEELGVALRETVERGDSTLRLGSYEELGVARRETAEGGDTTLRLDEPAPIEVGDFLQVDGVKGQFPTEAYGPMGIAQDPSTGRDERYPFDAGVVTVVDGETVTLDHPVSPYLRKGSKLYRYPRGRGNGVELLTVEGAGADDTSYYRLVDATDQIDFRLVEVTARWANRNFIDASGHGITVVGLTGIEGGAAGYQPEPCKYKVGFGPATDVTVVDSRIGSPDSDENMSLLTMQFVYRALVRNTTLGQSRSYSFNEHGGGSRDLVVENNWIGAGPSGWSGILLGNDTWGFGGETAVRNNRFVDNVVDVLMVENPYGVVIAGNRSQGCSQACVTWSGWGGGRDGDSAIADADRYGSARLTVVGNHFEAAANGLDLGTDESNGFPWVGIRDAVVADNSIESSEGTALTIRGDAAASGRLWITGNRFDGAVETADPGTDWWFWNNTAGPLTIDEARPDWLSLYQPWEKAEEDR